MPEMFLSTGEETSQDRERCWLLAGAQLLQPIPRLGKVMRLVAAPPSTFLASPFSGSITIGSFPMGSFEQI